MERLSVVFVVLLVVLALATILVIADPSDDVQALLRPVRARFSLAVLTCFLNSVECFSSDILSPQVASSRPVQTDELVNLICVRMC
jgi:hypothetical protein